MTKHQQHANGITIRYLDEGEGTGEVDGDDVVVLLHGGTESAERWSPYIDLLSAAGHRVIAPDTRGHGESRDPSATPLTYRLLADDVAALLDSLGIAHASFIGFSDGANTALELAMRYPRIVRSAVLHGCIVEFSEKYFAEIVGCLQGPDVEPAVAALVEPMWRTPLEYTHADYERATARLLVLTGDRDVFTTVEEQTALYRHLPNAELCVMPGIGHAFPRDPRAYVRIIEDFMARGSAR